MESPTLRTIVCLLLIAVLSSVQECCGEPLARVKRDHKPGHYSSTQEAKLMVIADVITYFLNQRGCSSKAIEQFFSQKCHGSPTGNDQKATFRTIVYYLEMLPEVNIYNIERKVQYGSVVVSTLSKGVSGSGGQVSFKYPEFIRHLQSSRQEYLYEQTSAMVIKYVVKYMYEVESTTYIKTSFHSLIESTYGSNEDSSDESWDRSESKSKKKPKKPKKHSSNSSG